MLFVAAGAFTAPAVAAVAKGNNKTTENVDNPTTKEAAPDKNTKTTDDPIVESEAGDDGKAAKQTDKKDGKKDNKKNDKKDDKKDNVKDRDMLTYVIAAFLLVLSLSALVTVFFLFRKVEKLRRSNEKLNIERKKDYEDLDKQISLVKNENKLIRNKMNELNVALDKLTESVSRPEEPAVEVKAEEYKESPRFNSSTFYGVYQSVYNGVLTHKLTRTKDNISTIKIETVSNTVANVSIVENLGNTQFSTMIGTAVEVVEGNPKQYESITQLACGVMELDEDVWVMKTRIKVKLS